MVDKKPAIVRYKNFRGETETRVLMPIEVWYGTSPHHAHEGDQWFVKAVDTERGLVRDFALKGFGG